MSFKRNFLRLMTLAFGVMSLVGIFQKLSTPMGHPVREPWDQLPSKPEPPPPEATPTARPVKPVASQPTQRLEPEPRHRELDGPSLAAMRLVQARFNSGDYDAALALARSDLSAGKLDRRYIAWLKEQMPALLTSSAWLKLQLGRCDDALPLFQESMTLKKTNETQKGLAICLFKARRLGEAEELFQSYLETVPSDQEMRIVYSDLLESNGRYQEAAKLIATAEASAELPTNISREDLAKRRSSMQAKAQESSHQVSASSDHILLTYRAEEHESLVNLCLETLELAIEEFQNQWGLKAPLTQIEVLLYPDDRFKDVVSYGPEWAQGIYDGRMRIPLGRAFVEGRQLDILRRILRHELSHAMLAEMTDRRALPTWLSEGFAQLVECPGGCSFSGFPATPGRFLERSVFEAKYTGFAEADANLAYKQSLFLVLMLARSPDVYGSDPLRSIFDSLTISSPLDTDTLLAKAGVEFTTLHQAAARRWADKSLP